jgi:pyruvate,water dikinase
MGMSDSTPTILPLEECRDAGLAGGKAVNLGVLLRAGFPVPGGFCVTTAAYRGARGFTPAPGTPGEGWGGGSEQKTSTVQSPLPNPPPEYRGRGQEEYRQNGNGHLPSELVAAILAAYDSMGRGPVAVRSSATAEDMAGASMAGQYDTFLHVHDEQTLLQAVKNCWQSLDSPRTRSYLKEHGIDINQVAMAVVVQRLARADTAGVLFTANPRTANRGEMLIEAAWGLGEAVVSGRVQPDVLRVDRGSGDVVDHRISDKRIMIPHGADGEVETPEHLRKAACLAEDHIKQLWQLGRKAADHFGGEQDIEWAIEDGRLYLLQSRPITTLQDAEVYEQILQSTRVELKREMEAGHGPWVRHNLGETLPHPTPLTWSVMKRFMSGAGGFGAMYRMAGFVPSPAVCADGFLRLIAGRVYMDASAAAGMFFDNFPFRYDVEALRSNPDAAAAPPTIPDGSLLSRWKSGRRIAAINRGLSRTADDLDHRLHKKVFPEFEKWVTQERSADLSRLSNTELAELWRSRQKRVMDELAPLSLLPSLVEGMVLGELRETLAETVWDEDLDEMAATLSSSPTPNLTLQADAGLFEIARGKRTIDQWLEQFGHRAAGEFDLSTPRWREQPDAVLSMANRLAGGADPMHLHEEHAAKVRAKVESLRQRMSAGEATEFERRLDRVWRYIAFREDGKYYLMLGYELLRQVALEAGKRLEVGADVFYLTEQEMLTALGAPNATPSPSYSGERAGVRGGMAKDAATERPSDKVAVSDARPLTPTLSPVYGGEGVVNALRETIAARKREYRAEARISVPHVVDAGAIETLGAPPKLSAEGTHEAFAVSTGVAVGPARIVRSPAEAGDLGKGYVLVCPSTDPNWTPLFVNAAALVLECGGTLSHGAVVAREMGLPAVVLADATQIFRDGEIIRVDGHHGAVGPASEHDNVAKPQATGESAEVEVDPLDIHIDPLLVPPPAGAKDRRAARLRNIGLLVWGIYLALAFLLPENWLYQPSLRVLDAVFWPLVPRFGKPATVAIIAAGIAVLTMVLQRILTDNARLLEAKRRANLLSKQAAKLPAGSPRRTTITRLTAPVQVRLLGAAIVPMALGLGPMMMSFFWMYARMDPATWNYPPGTPLQVVATPQASARGVVTLSASPELQLNDKSAQQIEDPAALQAALTQLLAAWKSPTPPSDPLLADQIAQAKSRGESPEKLEAFMSGGVKPAPLNWSIRPPNAAGAFPITVRGSDSAALTLTAVLGDVAPPEPRIVQGDPGTSLSEVQIVYTGVPASGFWKPFAGVTTKSFVDRGWNQWEVGWLVVYLIAYLPAMFLARKMLRLA